MWMEADGEIAYPSRLGVRVVHGWRDSLSQHMHYYTRMHNTNGVIA